MPNSLRKICVGAGLCAALILATAGCGPSTEPDAGATRPVPTAAGVPIGAPAGQQIDAGGGSFSSQDGLVRIDLPAGAVRAGTELSIQEITNLAPRGVASAYRLAPHGTTFAAPVTLTFRADLSSSSIDDLTVAYQDGSGYWSRVPNVVRDASAGTLTVTTLHLSDWTLVTGPTPRDLVGTFTISSSFDVPFTVDGAVTLTFAGENAEQSFYLLGGTHAPRAPIAVGAATCTPNVPTQALTTNLAELFKSPPDLWWGVSGYWDLSCSDSTSLAIEYAFDTLGLSKVSCARGWVGAPTLGPERVAGSYAIDCGARGTLTGSLSFQSASCGQPCQSSDPCRTATFDCTTGTAVCTASGNVADGTSCGTDLVCNAGTCVACAANQTCTTQPDPLCHAGVTSCATGSSVCEDGAALPNGTGCGTDLVCNAGACVACAANQSCTTQPDPLCHAGVTSCTTGSSVCENGAALPNGTSCGLDMVCNGGACLSCAANLACTTQPDPLCHTGVTNCATGTSVCVNGAALPNGTSCGVDMVCSGGVCASCTANQACTTQPDPLCHAGVTTCANGFSECLNGAALANGTSCGTDMVCNGGACVACAANQTCNTNPDTVCHAGVTSCSTGSSVCVDGAALPNGTGCGTDMVCNGGACVSCVADQPCTTQPDALCHVGVTSCSSGSSQCVNGAALANGTSCGTDMVCSAGACVSCVADQPCTTQPDALCHVGVTSCSSGSSACVNGAALANGTSCGTDMVCSAGTCLACAAGQSCSTPPDPLCHAGVTSCSTGTSVCENGAALPDGTSCGTDMVCSAGTCLACAAGQTCSTPPDPLCHAGVTSCSTGSSVCENGAALPNGTTCGVGQSCNGGSCVPSRLVQGTRLVTYWPDSGAPLAPVPAPDAYTPPLATVDALVPSAGGGFETYPGTIGAAGDISIPNVPLGTYILSLVDGAGAHTFLETAADIVDLGYDVLGRADAALPLASTPLTLDVTGVAPWTVGDEIQIVSSNGDVFDVPSRNAAITPGATTVSLVDDWLASALGGPMHLLVPADVLWVHDLATLTTTQPAGSILYPYLSAAGAAFVTGQTLTSGAPATVAVALGPAPTTGHVTGAPATGIDWRLTQFEAQLAAMTGLTVMPVGSVHSLVVGAGAHALANPAPMSAGTPTLFRLQLDAGTGDFGTAAGLSYGRFLETPLWSEWRGVELAVPVAYLLPPATTPLTERATIGQREAMSATPATPIVPTLLPVQSPAINGLGAFAALGGVTTTPTLSWSAPPLPSAVPTSYTVEILALDVSGASTVATRVASWRVAGKAVTVPASLLQAGRTYYARITANASAPEPLLTKPLSGEHTTAWATTLTGTFSP